MLLQNTIDPLGVNLLILLGGGAIRLDTVKDAGVRASFSNKDVYVRGQNDLISVLALRRSLLLPEQKIPAGVLGIEGPSSPYVNCLVSQRLK